MITSHQLVRSPKEDFRMGRIPTCATAAMIAVAGTVLVAQKVTNPAELDAAMKKIGPAQGAAGKAIQSGSFADAKAQVAIVKATLIGAQNFWEINKKDDAIAFSKDSIAKVTAVEEALAAPAPDQQAVLAAFKAVGGTCGACHKTYRVQDENMQYILKPGSI